MQTLTLKIKYPIRKSKKIQIDIDANHFEKLAADFGFFNPDFINSLEHADDDIKAGRVKKITALRVLR